MILASPKSYFVCNSNGIKILTKKVVLNIKKGFDNLTIHKITKLTIEKILPLRIKTEN
ncbi:hypothetical protein IWX84_002964 [Flavobacterium sp. CG_9.10]|nr:hypothetical protein [Flavobacterium sp. CG_9.10]